MNVSELKRKQPTLAIVTAAIAVELGMGVQAQQPQQQPRPQTDQQIARSDAGMQALDQYLQSKSLRVSKVDGMELQTRSGDNLGEVEDVMRGATPGQMRLIVKIGGVGADSKLIAVPFNEVPSARSLPIISRSTTVIYATATRRITKEPSGRGCSGRSSTRGGARSPTIRARPHGFSRPSKST